MSVCHKSHYFQVTTSWIAEEDDIYIMVECILSVSHKSDYFQVTTSWIAEDDDIQ